jgi:hypothetical protein
MNRLTITASGKDRYEVAEILRNCLDDFPHCNCMSGKLTRNSSTVEWDCFEWNFGTEKKIESVQIPRKEILQAVSDGWGPEQTAMKTDEILTSITEQIGCLLTAYDIANERNKK